MNTSTLRQALRNGASPRMILPGGRAVPAHFHLTEFGVVTKDFVDCGGTFRQERKATLQLWASVDLHHRLTGERFLEILDKGVAHFDANELEVQVEVQGEQTLEVYGLNAVDGQLRLTGTETACLAGVACELPRAVQSAGRSVKKQFDNLATAAGSCAPESGCC